jgi:hydrogenase large subunit
MRSWINEVAPGGPVYQPFSMPESATAQGLTEAPRGALGHWLRIAKGKVANYQIITPTCWNASPRDGANVRGPVEEALVGTPVRDLNEPIEVLRVIHAFDPCLSCAVHVMRPAENAKIFTVPHFHGPEEIHAHSHGHDHSHDHAH